MHKPVWLSNVKEQTRTIYINRNKIILRCLNQTYKSKNILGRVELQTDWALSGQWSGTKVHVFKHINTLLLLMSVAWGVKVSQIHSVCSWSVTLTHKPVSVSCSRGGERQTFTHGRDRPAGSVAEALGVAAGLGSWCVCWWWVASSAAKKGRRLVCAGGASASAALRCP